MLLQLWLQILYINNNNNNEKKFYTKNIVKLISKKKVIFFLGFKIPLLCSWCLCFCLPLSYFYRKTKKIQIYFIFSYKNHLVVSASIHPSDTRRNRNQLQSTYYFLLSHISVYQFSSVITAKTRSHIPNFLSLFSSLLSAIEDLSECESHSVSVSDPPTQQCLWRSSLRKLP